MKEEIEKQTIILFGATGDLAKRKLLPALAKMFENGQLNDMPIIATGRQELSTEEYLDEMDFKKICKGEHLDQFKKQISYHSLPVDMKDAEKLYEIVSKADKKHNCKGNTLFYLSIASELFIPSLDMIEKSGLLKNGKNKIAFEKPFGHDLKSSENLNKEIMNHFKEEEVYRVDHYLGKELVENIIVFRFSNAIFEEVWNNKFVDNIQITLMEELGVINRGEYYDATGAIRDMVQNHMLQLLSLTTMEFPECIGPKCVRDEKLKVLKKIKIPKKEDIVVGQYEGYHSEKSVSPDSNTETFVAFKTEIKNKRWKGVPIYLRTGKSLEKKYSEINIILKDVSHKLFAQPNTLRDNNVISIRIEPQDGLVIKFNAKKPETREELYPVAMEFCHECEFGGNTPQAYETLLPEILKGNQTLFARSDEIRESWKFTDKLRNTIKNKKPIIYKKGSSGPKEADELLQKSKHHWIKIMRKFS